MPEQENMTDETVKKELTEYISSLDEEMDKIYRNVFKIQKNEPEGADEYYDDIIQLIPTDRSGLGLTVIPWNWNNYASTLLTEVAYEEISDKIKYFYEQRGNFYREKNAKDIFKAYFGAKKAYADLFFSHTKRLLNFQIIDLVSEAYKSYSTPGDEGAFTTYVLYPLGEHAGILNESVRTRYKRYCSYKKTTERTINEKSKTMQDLDKKVDEILGKPFSEWKELLEAQDNVWKTFLGDLPSLIKKVDFDLNKRLTGEKPLEKKGIVDSIVQGGKKVLNVLGGGSEADIPEQFKKTKENELAPKLKEYNENKKAYMELKVRYNEARSNVVKADYNISPEYQDRWEKLGGEIEECIIEIETNIEKYHRMMEQVATIESLTEDFITKANEKAKGLMHSIDEFCQKIKYRAQKNSDEKGLLDLVEGLEEIATKVINGEEVPIPIAAAAAPKSEENNEPSNVDGKEAPKEDKKEPSKADEKETPNNGESDLGKPKVQEKEDAKNTSEPKEQQAPKVNDQELEDIKLFLNELNALDYHKDINIDVTYNALSSPNILRRLQNITNKDVKTQLENKFKQFKQYMAQEISEFSRQVSVADYVSQEDLMKIDDNLKGTEVGKGLKVLAEKIKKLEDTKARRLHQDVPKENKKAEKDYRVSAIRMFIDKYEHRLKKYQDPKDKKVFIPQEKGAKTPKEAATKEFVNALRDARLSLHGLDVTKKSEIVNVWKGLQSRDGIDKFIDGLKKDSHCKGKTEEMLYTLYGILYLYITGKITENSDNLKIMFDKYIRKRFDGLSGFAMRLGGATIYALREQFKSLITFLYFFLHDCKIKEIKNNDSSAETQ